MRAFVITAPGQAEVADVPEPVAASGEVVVDVQRAGVCGTDVEFYTGHMAYLHDGNARYPVRIGHEWMGVVTEVGDGVDASWLGRRVTGDTMLGCGRCRLCLSGRQHVCAEREEVGIRRGRAGALAERIAMPATSLHALPDTLDDTLGALVEPAGNGLRAARAAASAEHVLVVGPGTIGLLAAMFARAEGSDVHLVGVSQASVDFARTLGFDAWLGRDAVPDLPFDAVIDAATDAATPARAVDLVQPGGRVVLIGISPAPSLVDTRSMLLKDVTAVGILSASPGLDGAIAGFASGAVDARPLVAATVGLDGVAAVLAGERPVGAGKGPKVHVDPRA
ncbi:zinc-binding dehydrogenase [Humibacter sp. RRB41]|uniref:zinc-dependent alcohol dehydrogenase n=1 Tax=Humibacter sp. RRB41 TaxID=2919946 RepID=UPI001FAA4F67|nr:alcohol dehydrogenase catalytic domain-containing protein [Humibacter sp. RRB41]